MTVRSIFSNIENADIRHEPFPHAIIRDVYPEEEFSKFEKAFPSLDIVSNGKEMKSNYAYLLDMQSIQQGLPIDPIWSDFFDYHTSSAFFREVMTVFGDDIRRLYPGLEKHWGCRVEELEAKMRTHDWAKTEERPTVDMEVQFGINSPVQQESVVRGPHVDSRYKLYNALWYFRDKDDQSTGGGLAFYSYKNGKPTFSGKQPAAEDVDQYEVVEYDRNCLVLFINSPYSVHGVTPRSVTPFGRRYVNFAAEVYDMPNDRLFDRPQKTTWQLTRLAQLARSGDFGRIAAAVKRRLAG